MAPLLYLAKQERWIKEEAKALLEVGDVPADCVCDLKTNGNELSVWEIDEGHLLRVVCAITLGSSGISPRGYLIFDSDLLPALDIDISSNNPGDTEDEGINHRHRDLINLTGKKLVALARAILEHGDSGIALKKEIEDQIRTGVESRYLPPKALTKLKNR